jgi:hypothetical protein
VNLVRYLSELGKIGDYALPREQYVRTWEVLSGPTDDEITETDLQRTLTSTSQTWSPSYSVINGSLPVSDMPLFKINGRDYSAVRFSVARTNPLQQIQVIPADGIRVWSDGHEQDTPSSEFQLPQQDNEFVILIDRAANIDRISVEILDGTGK